MKLVSLSLIGLMLAGVIYVAQASAQTPKAQPAKMQSASCAAEPRDVSLYFERDKVELNEFSKALVERVANEARNCGLTQVVAEARLDAKRAAVISETFQAHKIRVIMVGTTATAPQGGDVAARSAKMRLTLASKIG